MQAPWSEVFEGSGLWRLAAVHEAFGPFTVLAIELAPRKWGLVSAPKAASDAVIASLTAAGEVVALIAPNIAHVSGLNAWAQRCPGALIYGPDDQVDAMARKTGLAFSPISTLEADAGLQFRAAPFTRSGALWLRCERAAQPVVYLDEVLITMEQRPAWWVSRWLYRLTGTRPGLSVNHLFMRALCTDTKTYAQAVQDFAHDAGAIIVAHGDPIVGGVQVERALSLLRPYARR